MTRTALDKVREVVSKVAHGDLRITGTLRRRHMGCAYRTHLLVTEGNEPPNDHPFMQLPAADGLEHERAVTEVLGYPDAHHPPNADGMRGTWSLMPTCSLGIAQGVLRVGPNLLGRPDLLRRV